MEVEAICNLSPLYLPGNSGSNDLYVVLDEEGQVSNNLLRLSRDFLGPIKRERSTFHVHICRVHVGNRVPIWFVESNSCQAGSFLSIICCFTLEGASPLVPEILLLGYVPPLV